MALVKENPLRTFEFVHDKKAKSISVNYLGKPWLKLSIDTLKNVKNNVMLDDLIKDGEIEAEAAKNGISPKSIRVLTVEDKFNISESPLYANIFALALRFMAQLENHYYYLVQGNFASILRKLRDQVAYDGVSDLMYVFSVKDDDEEAEEEAAEEKVEAPASENHQVLLEFRLHKDKKIRTADVTKLVLKDFKWSKNQIKLTTEQIRTFVEESHKYTYEEKDKPEPPSIIDDRSKTVEEVLYDKFVQAAKDYISKLERYESTDDAAQVYTQARQNISDRQTKTNSDWGTAVLSIYSWEIQVKTAKMKYDERKEEEAKQQREMTEAKRAETLKLQRQQKEAEEAANKAESLRKQQQQKKAEEAEAAKRAAAEAAKRAASAEAVRQAALLQRLSTAKTPQEEQQKHPDAGLQLSALQSQLTDNRKKLNEMKATVLNLNKEKESLNVIINGYKEKVKELEQAKKDASQEDIVRINALQERIAQQNKDMTAEIVAIKQEKDKVLSEAKKALDERKELQDRLERSEQLRQQEKDTTDAKITNLERDLQAAKAAAAAVPKVAPPRVVAMPAPRAAVAAMPSPAVPLIEQLEKARRTYIRSKTEDNRKKYEELTLQYYSRR